MNAIARELRTSEPPPAIVDRGWQGAVEREWFVPIDLIMAMPTSSVIVKVIKDRFAKGDRPERDVRVFTKNKGDRLFAEIRWTHGDRWLLLPLDVWALL